MRFIEKNRINKSYLFALLGRLIFLAFIQTIGDYPVFFLRKELRMADS